MLHLRSVCAAGALALFVVLGGVPASADDDNSIKTVFVIAMDNHNWTQPANQFSGPIQQIFQNPDAPFINSLVNGTALATINGRQVNISEQVAMLRIITMS
jgi:heptaprenylglyceryl phosphate synthase